MRSKADNSPCRQHPTPGPPQLQIPAPVLKPSCRPKPFPQITQGNPRLHCSAPMCATAKVHLLLCTHCVHLLPNTQWAGSTICCARPVGGCARPIHGCARGLGACARPVRWLCKTRSWLCKTRPWLRKAHPWQCKACSWLREACALQQRFCLLDSVQQLLQGCLGEQGGRVHSTAPAGVQHNLHSTQRGSRAQQGR
jgi:hypothetical protein